MASIKEAMGFDTERTKSEKQKMLNAIDATWAKNDKLRNAIWNLKPSDLDKLKPKFENFKAEMDNMSREYPTQVASFKEDFIRNMEIYAWVDRWTDKASSKPIQASKKEDTNHVRDWINASGKWSSYYARLKSVSDAVN